MYVHVRVLISMCTCVLFMYAHVCNHISTYVEKSYPCLCRSQNAYSTVSFNRVFVFGINHFEPCVSSSVCVYSNMRFGIISTFI